MRVIPRDNNFYRKHYHHAILVVMGLLCFLMLMVGVVLYQFSQKPLPVFTAISPKGEVFPLTPFEEPNLLPDTILRWASKAATYAYNFNFRDYREQLGHVRPFFTDDGWNDYLISVDALITNIIQNQLFVYGMVSGTPVFSNQGELPGKGYVWRVQIPFLVTYQSADSLNTRQFYVVISIVRVPTSKNPQGIGIDQFVMYEA